MTESKRLWERGRNTDRTMAGCSCQRRRDSCCSCVVCFSASLATAVTMGLVFSCGVVYPVLLDYFKEGKYKTALVGSLGMAMILFTGPLVGILIDRFECRITSLLGGVTCTVSLILTSFSDNLGVMYFSYSLLMGLGTGLVFASSLVIVAKYFDKRRGWALGAVGSGESLGIMCLAPILQSLLSACGWRNTYRIMSVIVFVVCLLGCFYYPDVENEHKASASEASEENLAQDSEEKHLLTEETRQSQFLNLDVWKKPAFVKIVLLSAVVQFAHWAPSIHMVRYCEEIGIPATSASRLYTYAAISALFSKILFGRLCDVEWVKVRYVSQAAESLAGAATILMILSHKYAVLVVYYVIFGLCEGAFLTSLTFIVLTCVPAEQRASATGWQWLSTSFSVVSGPSLVGLMAQKLGSYVPAFYMVGCVLIFGSLVPSLLYCWKDETPETSHGKTAEYTELK